MSLVKDLGKRRMFIGPDTAQHGQEIVVPPKDDMRGYIVLPEPDVEAMMEMRLPVEQAPVRFRRFTRRRITAPAGKGYYFSATRSYFAEQSIDDKTAMALLAKVLIGNWIRERADR